MNKDVLYIYIRHKGDEISVWKVSTLILLLLRYSSNCLIISFFGAGSRNIESFVVEFIYSQLPTYFHNFR